MSPIPSCLSGDSPAARSPGPTPAGVSRGRGQPGPLTCEGFCGWPGLEAAESVRGRRPRREDGCGSRGPTWPGTALQVLRDRPGGHSELQANLPGSSHPASLTGRLCPPGLLRLTWRTEAEPFPKLGAARPLPGKGLSPGLRARGLAPAPAWGGCPSAAPRHSTSTPAHTDHCAAAGRDPRTPGPQPWDKFGAPLRALSSTPLSVFQSPAGLGDSAQVK